MEKLKKGHTRSCGCKSIEVKRRNCTIHGFHKDRLYKIWVQMQRRCYNPKSSDYKNYGNRGIVISEEWLQSYENFRDWSLENGYGDKLTIDRIDNDAGYYSHNCRWITRQQNSFNRRGSTSKSCSSRHKGVSFVKKTGKWRSSIQKDGIVYGLGQFLTEDEAARAYNKKARELFGEHAYLNKIDDE